MQNLLTLRISRLEERERTTSREHEELRRITYLAKHPLEQVGDNLYKINKKFYRRTDGVDWVVKRAITPTKSTELHLEREELGNYYSFGDNRLSWVQLCTLQGKYYPQAGGQWEILSLAELRGSDLSSAIQTRQIESGSSRETNRARVGDDGSDSTKPVRVLSIDELSSKWGAGTQAKEGRTLRKRGRVAEPEGKGLQGHMGNDEDYKRGMPIKQESEEEPDLPDLAPSKRDREKAQIVQAAENLFYMRYGRKQEDKKFSNLKTLADAAVSRWLDRRKGEEIYNMRKQ